MSVKLEKNWNTDDVVMVGVFWHNEGPGGFGIIIGPDWEENGEAVTAQEIVNAMENAYQGFLKEMAEDPADCEKWLSGEIYEQIQAAAELYQSVDGAANLPGMSSMNQKQLAEFLLFGPTNVYILERLGRLDPVDEHNGCVVTHKLKK